MDTMTGEVKKDGVIYDGDDCMSLERQERVHAINEDSDVDQSIKCMD